LKEYFPHINIKLISSENYNDEYYEEPWSRDELLAKINAGTNILIQKGWFFMYKPAFAIRDILIEELAFTKELPDYVRNLLTTIRNTCAVSIHIRRGDYILPQYYYKVGHVCTLSYYKNAVNYMAAHYTDLKFYVFTNDIDWVKSNFGFINDYVIVDTSGYELSSYYDLFLMSRCKHNIIANSTFSWWSAFLNQNPQKDIITPTDFEDKYIVIDDVCPPEWIRVPSIVPSFTPNSYIYEIKE
jgi:hypothetical protein